MKKHLLFLFAIFTFVVVSAQTPVEVNWLSQSYPANVYFGFEQPGDQNYIALDTASGNIWQIGHPQKTNFTSAIWGQNSLVTDTINAYPVNNVSSFTIRIINYNAYLCTYFQFEHKYLTTAGQDGGTIEVSHDQGITWKNLIEDSFYIYDYNCGNGPTPYAINDTVAALGKPGFSGNSSGVLTHNFSFMPLVNFSFQNDTIDLRFTFASDNTAENLDGWMIDEINVGAVGEGIPENAEVQSFVLFPNPSAGVFHVNDLKQAESITVYDARGNKVTSPVMNGNQLDLSFLPGGIYEVIVNTGKNITAGTVIINH